MYERVKGAVLSIDLRLCRFLVGYNRICYEKALDELEMKAMTDHYGDRDIAVNAVKAGVDILLMPSDLDKTIDALIDAVETGEKSCEGYMR